MTIPAWLVWAFLVIHVASAIVLLTALAVLPYPRPQKPRQRWQDALAVALSVVCGLFWYFVTRGAYA